MRFQTARNLLVGASAAGILLPAVTDAKTCLCLYQMADNNLEYYLRQDYQELTGSPVISGGDLRTWVYYDALNQGGQALPNTIDSNGNEVTGEFLGSRYITYDPGFGKMRIVQELSGEQNSDTPDSVQSFLETCFADCLANGHTSLMTVFSSHGGGFAGYGGDENARKLLLKGDEETVRKLLQTNQGIASAIRAALDATGAGAKVEVIGFDACLMSAVEAVDDYKDVAQYMLASEAVEPGHGWAYSYLTSASSALELARQILETFISQTQGGSSHQAPKTMAIVDTDKFSTFIDSFESLSADLLAQLEAGDTSLHTFISRARSAAVAFEGIVDAVGATNPSALDLGSWLLNFQELCLPGEPMQTDLQTAIDNYSNMFVATGFGEGTAQGTGIHMSWPNQGEYAANAGLWNQVLFENANYVTQIIPNFRAFLEYFLTSSTPAANDVSICGLGAIPDSSPGNSGNSNGNNGDDGNNGDNGNNGNAGNSDNGPGLIIQESHTYDEATGIFQVSATIAPEVSQMLVEYGIDLSQPLKPVLREKGYEPTDDEYLILLGGDVQGTYQGSQFDATWDSNFYFLNISGADAYEALYVFDQGDGSKKIPAMYFPEELRQEVSEIQFLDYLFFDFNKWTEKGARFSFLMFSVDEAVGRINDNLSLFISNADGVFAEQPRSKRGMMIPLIYIDAYIQGRKLNTLPGGFNQTVINWSEEIDYNVLTTPVDNIFNVIPETDAVVVNMYAFNHGDPTAEPDVEYYDIRRQKGIKPFSVTPGGGDSGSTLESTGSDTSSAVSVNSGFGLLAGLVFFFFGLL